MAGSRLQIAPIALAVCAAAVLTAVSQARPSTSYLIQASATFQRLGDYWVSRNPSFEGAIEALGEPSSCRLVGGSPTVAYASWRSLGVRMHLVTFGGMPTGETGCTAPDEIHVSTIRVTGKRWYTSKMLQVGSSVARLRRLYPKAIANKGVRGWYGRGYWLVTARRPCLGICGGVRWETAPVLVAETRAGRVSSIVFVVGAQGE